MPPDLSQIRPVILCGGMGNRLKPLSTPEKPKPFLPLLSDLTMLQQTVLRVKTAKSPAILCNRLHGQLVEKDLMDLNIRPDVIIEEPISKNTAPAAALAARYYEAWQSPDEILLFLPSDHRIGDLKAFHTALERALPLVKAGDFVLFGEKPTCPDTGYGYIKTYDDSFDIELFQEKPQVEVAAQYIRQGCYWNTGILMVECNVLISAIKTYQSQIWDVVEKVSLPRPEQALFDRISDISIDYALLEHVKNRKMLPISMEWGDIGTLDRLKALA